MVLLSYMELHGALIFTFCLSCEPMHACVRVRFLVCTRRMRKVIAARQCMHVCMCVLMNQAYDHCDCCEAMHVYAYLCVLSTRHTVTVIAAR